MLIPEHSIRPVDDIFKEIEEEIKPLFGKGKTADYIPALKNADPNKFGLTLTYLDGSSKDIGDSRLNFSIQSISKVFLLVMAYKVLGGKLWHRVGKEPSGNPFNSLVQLEYENGVPRNPFINAGALVITDILISHFDDARSEILSFAQNLAGHGNVQYDYEVFHSELKHAFTNAALVNYIKSHGNIKNDVNEVLDTYLLSCSISMCTHDLSHAFLFLANNGYTPNTNERILSKSQAKRINAIMLTCGFYDESGDFAYKVGLPGKSGVSGAVAALAPGHWTIAAYSPELNSNGNSVIGIRALELFTTKSEISIF